MYWTVFWNSVGEGKGGMKWENDIKTCKLSYVKRIASPGSMHDKGAQGWCTGMTLRDGIGRAVGGGFGMGYTCIPNVDFVNVWQNQYNTVK